MTKTATTKAATTKKRAEHVARTRPEWITFGVSALVLLTVVGVLVMLSFSADDPAIPVARTPGSVQQEAGQFFVPVEIVNDGDEGAAEVQVTAELTINGETTSGDQTIDFLGGGEVQELTFVFTDDPADGELKIFVASFAKP